MATLEKATKVYVCCGEYIATTKACTDSKIKCPRCGKLLTTPVQFPSVLIAKKS